MITSYSLIKTKQFQQIEKSGKLIPLCILQVVKDGGKHEKCSVQIVPFQGNPNMGTINQNSAIARVLLGSTKGDEVEAILPSGEVTLMIQEIDKTHNV